MRQLSSTHLTIPHCCCHSIDGRVGVGKARRIVNWNCVEVERPARPWYVERRQNHVGVLLYTRSIITIIGLPDSRVSWVPHPSRREVVGLVESVQNHGIAESRERRWRSHGPGPIRKAQVCVQIHLMTRSLSAASSLAAAALVSSLYSCIGDRLIIDGKKTESGFNIFPLIVRSNVPPFRVGHVEKSETQKSCLLHLRKSIRF